MTTNAKPPTFVQKWASKHSKNTSAGSSSTPFTVVDYDAIERDRKTNESAIQELKTELATGQTLGFVGNGCSIPLGYPSWRKLVSDLVDLYAKVSSITDAEIQAMKKEDDLSAIANICKDKLTHGYLAHLSKEFSTLRNPSFSSEHLALWHIPFIGLMTTNYDRCLESAFAHLFGRAGKIAEPFTSKNRDKVVEFLKYSGAADQRNHLVFHIHGSSSDVESCVLSLGDYGEVYLKENKLKSDLSTLFRVHKALFVGFGLEDTDFETILRELKEVCEEWNGPYFAILPYSSSAPTLKRQILRKKLNVEAIFYHAKGSNHSARGTLLEELAKPFLSMPLFKKLSSP